LIIPAATVAAVFHIFSAECNSERVRERRQGCKWRRSMLASMMMGMETAEKE